MNKSQRTKYITLSIIGVIGIAIFVGLAIALTNPTDETESNQEVAALVEESSQENDDPIDGAGESESITQTDPDEATDTTEQATTPTTLYADGSYTSTKTYNSPGGAHPITVNITIANDVISAVDISSDDGGNRVSQSYQAEFADAYESEVQGKSVGDVSLSRVGGASLTTNGFNEALAAIKADARN